MYELFNNFIKIGFDPKTGAIVSMQNLCTGYEMIRQPALSLGLTALIPVKDHRNNPAQSAMQELSSFQKSASGKKVVLTYDKITTDWAGTLAVSVEITCRMEEMLCDT